MPLNVSALQSGLERAFASPGADDAECAQAWADAVRTYASGIVPPSAAVNAAATTLAGALTAAFAAPNAIPGMVAAFTSFAAAVGGGQAGYAPVPPPVPLALPPHFAAPKPPTHAAAARALATLIDAWMRTGVSTLVAPPNTAVPWS